VENAFAAGWLVILVAAVALGMLGYAITNELSPPAAPFAAVAGVALIPGFFWLADHLDDVRQGERAEEQRLLREADHAQFAKFCVDSDLQVRTRVEQPSDNALLLVVPPNLTGQVNPHAFAECMRSGWHSSCKALPFKAVQALRPGTQIYDQVAVTGHYHPFTIAKPTARYALVFGDASRPVVPYHEDTVMLGQPFPNWMSRIRAKLVEFESGSELGSVSVYFLKHETGVAGCPHAVGEAARLLEAVFGKGKS